MSNPDRILLILDLDETLVHSTPQRLARPHDSVVAGHYYVYVRPHVTSFLASCAQYYQIGIWSAAGEGYVDAVVQRIMPEGVVLTFVWGRQRCTRRFDFERHEEYAIKDLKKVKRLGYDLGRILIVEDSPENVQRHYGNAIYVRSYYGDPKDNELSLLSRYLASIRALDDVRRVEKRFWRNTVAEPAHTAAE